MIKAISMYMHLSLEPITFPNKCQHMFYYAWPSKWLLSCTTNCMRPHQIYIVCLSKSSLITLIIICILFEPHPFLILWWWRCCVLSPCSDLSPATVEAFWHLVANHLAQGLADNWSQVGEHGITPNVFILLCVSFEVCIGDSCSDIITMNSLAKLLMSLDLCK